MLKHYVEFDLPGAFMPETETRTVATRIPANLKRIPRYCYAIEFYSREEVSKGKETLTGRAKKRSKRIVFGKVYRQDDLPALGFGPNTTLYRNADYGSSGKKLIKCIAGNWQPWDKNWIILENHAALKTLTEAI